jgi:hypothetical protein
MYPYFSAAGIPTLGPTLRNGGYTQYGTGDSEIYVTQRFPLNITKVATSTTGYKGRGCYAWNPLGTTGNYTYLVNGNTVYLADYGSPLIDGTISDSNTPVTFVEVGEYLLLIDTAGNKVYYIDQAASNTLVEITDVAFPFNAGYTLAGGGVSLNAILYLMDTEGNIWNNLNPYFGGGTPNTGTEWAGDYIQAARDSDGGAYLALHHNNIVAFGHRTVEVFYDAGNPVGSPLNRREDVMYGVGVSGKYDAYTSGDTIFFLGVDSKGVQTAFIFENFQYKQVADDAFTKYINNSINYQNMVAILGGVRVGEHNIFTLTLCNGTFGSTKLSPVYTAAYDATKNQWSSYDSQVFSDDVTAAFPVIASSTSSQYSNIGLMMFSTGDLGTVNATDALQDTAGDTVGYWSEPYITPDNSSYIEVISSDRVANIQWEMVTSATNLDRNTNKFCSQFSVLGGTAPTADDDQTVLKISWTDDGYKTFSTPRDLDFANYRTLTRLGKFRERAYKMTYNGTGKLEIIGYTMRLGTSAYA